MVAYIAQTKTVLNRFNIFKRFKNLKNKTLYLLLLPSLIYIIIFNFIPLSGLVIAFKD